MIKAIWHGVSLKERIIGLQIGGNFRKEHMHSMKDSYICSKDLIMTFSIHL